MITCPQCGIQREPDFTECPLCKSKFTDDQEVHPPRSQPYPGIEKELSGKERIRLFWELSGLLHLSSIIVLLFIDVMLNRKPGWSIYALAGIAASYCYITLFVFAGRKPFLLLSGILLNSCALLFIIDILHNGLTWFLVPALPLALFLVLFIGLIVFFNIKTEHRGLNIIAAAALAIGAYNIVIELCINWMHNHHVFLTWSLVVAASILPFSFMLLYIHYRLKRGTSLRKFFHL
jgi:hypothetical protein